MTDEQILLENLKFEEKEDYEKGFSDYFEKTIKPELKPLEELRIQSLAKIEKNKKTFYIFIPILIIVGILISPFLYNKDGRLMLIIPIILMIWWIRIMAPEQIFDNSIREKLVPLVVKFFDSFNYDKDKKIDTEILKASKRFGTYDDYQSNDNVSGNHHGVPIEMQETVLTSGSRKSMQTVFNGQTILAKMNKKFIGRTVVKCDAGKISNFILGKPEGLERVKLEDPKFENLFEVFSTDQVEARYLLTTAFMERLIKLSELYKKNSLECVFFDEFILITIFIDAGAQLVNIFQPSPIEESIINTDDIHEFLAKIHEILATVDVLKLSSDTEL